MSETDHYASPQSNLGETPEQVSGFGWYTKVVKNFVVFQGRASRSEYWMFQLFNALIMFGIIIVEAMIYEQPIIGVIYILAMILPNLSVSVRRMHDTGRSGWWLLVSFVPVVGGLIFLIFTLLASEAGSNRFGPNPKGM